MTQPLKLLALAASFRPESLNKKLLALAVKKAEEAGAQVTTLDYAACDAPVYRNDGSQPTPAGVTLLTEALSSHHGLLLASPEYNWAPPGGLKNLIDWLSIQPGKPLKGKHALLLCASPSVRGGVLGLSQLKLPLAQLGVHVYPQLVSVGQADAALASAEGIDAKNGAFLNECVTDFVRLANLTQR